MAICEFFFNALKIDCFILKVPVLLVIALPGTQRKSTKGWGIAEAYRYSAECQCYKLFVTDTIEDNYPYYERNFWKKTLNIPYWWHGTTKAILTIFT